MALNNELEGILVVSIEQAVAAPYCGLLLADAGARVIKIERSGGDFARSYDTGIDGQSAIFAWLNRGKESICLDLKTVKDFNLLINILRKADVLLSNLAPGAIERLGLIGNDLRKENSRLVTCSISGYGDSKLAKNKKAYDFLVQAESGLCAVTGTEKFPSRVGISVADLSTGLTAFSAILRSLLQRERTGVGIDLKISMFDVMADWMNMPLLAHRYMGGAPARMGLQHSFIAPYGAFKSKNGDQILISIQSNREFNIFCKGILEDITLSENPKFADNPSRYKNHIILDKIVSGVFETWETEPLIKKLDSLKIANARMNTVEELSRHPFLKTSTAIIGANEINVAALPVHSEGLSSKKVPNLNESESQIRDEFSKKNKRLREK